MAAADASSTDAPRSAWLIATALLVAIVVAYAFWPLMSAANLLRAARNGDAIAIEAYVDFPRLRRSIARQIVVEAVRQHPIQGPERQLALGAGTTALAAWLDELLTPKILADMFGGRAVAPSASNAPVDLSPIRTVPLRGLLRIWWHSGFASPMRYDLTLPRPDGGAGLLVGMELRGTGWKVTRLDLPDDVREGLARRLSSLAGTRPGQP